MQFYKFWTRAESKAQGTEGEIAVTCYGYSNESIEDALAVAERRAREAVSRSASGIRRADEYYESGPIREEIVDEFQDDGKTIAVVSRNSYGCLILNTPDVFFADVDLPERPASSGGLFSTLFGGVKNTEPEGQKLADRLSQIVRTDPSLLLRLYRTLMGFRVMVVSKLIPATSRDSRELLTGMGADKLYASLCQSQDCYRARLTPKPWRCGYRRPPTRYPFTSDFNIQRMNQWRSAYRTHAADYSTCHLVAQFGSAAEHPVAMNVAELHDHYSIGEDKALA